MQAALRQAEAATALCAARRRVTLENAFGEEFDPIAAKLVADVCGFLVTAAGLPPEFRTQARAFVLSEPVTGESAAANSAPTSGSQPAKTRARASDPRASGAPVSGSRLASSSETNPEANPHSAAPTADDETQPKLLDI
jgi:hypothetical protein